MLVCNKQLLINLHGLNMKGNCTSFRRESWRLSTELKQLQKLFKMNEIWRYSGMWARKWRAVHSISVKFRIQNDLYTNAFSSEGLWYDVWYIWFHIMYDVIWYNMVYDIYDVWYIWYDRIYDLIWYLRYNKWYVYVCIYMIWYDVWCIYIYDRIHVICN
jgi:hypothetical protein